MLFLASLAGWHLQASSPCQRYAVTKAPKTMLATKAAELFDNTDVHYQANDEERKTKE